MTEQTVLIQTDQRGVATVTLNNPAKHNVFDDKTIEDLTAAFEQISTSKDVRVMILAATGKNFCAGGDLAWMKRMAKYSYDENLNDSKVLARMFKILNFLTVPTIARVQGVAFGGGVGLVSCCDMAVATPDASFSLSEVKIGLIPAVISPYVVAAIGQRAARRYFTTAERFDAQTAFKLGLVSKVVEKEQLNSEIDKLAETLLANSPTAIVDAKQLIFDVAGRKIDDELIDFTCERIADIRVSANGQEGLSAFLEKRKPTWSVK
jgi:methylglutaconyl-CoA hydratase